MKYFVFFVCILENHKIQFIFPKGVENVLSFVISLPNKIVKRSLSTYLSIANNILNNKLMSQFK